MAFKIPLGKGSHFKDGTRVSADNTSLANTGFHFHGRRQPVNRFKISTQITNGKLGSWKGTAVKRLKVVVGDRQELGPIPFGWIADGRLSVAAVDVWP